LSIAINTLHQLCYRGLYTDRTVPGINPMLHIGTGLGRKERD
jgi:hypothetical protein